jgi:hypothetical protein
MDQLRCPCCGGGIDAKEWLEVRQWLQLMDINFDLDGTVDTKGAARLLGKAVQTLENWRSIGGGPAYSKDASGRIRYHLDDICGYREGFKPELHMFGVKDSLV